jgi:hypothetical protein
MATLLVQVGTNERATLPLMAQRPVEVVPVGPRTITNLESRLAFTNEGALAIVDFNLPPAVANLECGPFLVQNANGLRVNAAAGDTVSIGGSASVAGGNARCVQVGGVVLFLCINATEWDATTVQRVWIVT